jgi:hypothetical protein
MVFTYDYNNSQNNDLLPVSKPNRYENHKDVPDVDYGHMHSQATLSGDRKYDIVRHNVVYSTSEPLIIKLYPDCDKTRSKNTTLFLANTDILSEFSNKSSTGNNNYSLLSDKEKEIKDTYYLGKPSNILKNNDDVLKPANFKGTVSDVPNRNIPLHHNISERVIKKTGKLQPV